MPRSEDHRHSFGATALSPNCVDPMAKHRVIIQCCHVSSRSKPSVVVILWPLYYGHTACGSHHIRHHKECKGRTQDIRECRTALLANMLMKGGGFYGNPESRALLAALATLCVGCPKARDRREAETTKEEDSHE